ncbi:radical SAM protein [Rhodobacter sphaeroides]|jgi:MoaA/NifB/PqqE/SkfB family radical SAM enzyme|uniref:Radical SAM superfamily protein n=1 Tax=Cereibacter sphaeroides (strain ATCC 17023 / DSM 158 / JCM 6121 / CCUG 31486 / LMG 2827 / NBRC 12203 / NCIMB 8253 / ATH 2.4.1.) TaxID=272943 RepID=Q3IV13_CERS4|nr:radical SAM protein [Cereibacter sphaeroides]ABA81621.1 Radical SAM superfamily protein [Cereibacter sphaeroides 2.4.1]AMJ49763.1 radical SAM superfamily protein [Cereibacter sphaeroides]ANS36523.1 radical SAM superfamily protein [Cereibacter sphaeroides]ATN65535.1 radical SAM superfamily protein [Cereibacter sphaeroides]AXC64150.1 radical SAM protein [Cereibacter sphaeroides 2.4.1]
MRSEAKNQKPTAYPMKGIDDLPLHEIIEPALDITSPQVACVGIGVRAVCNYDCVYCYAGHSDKRGDMSVEQYFDVMEQAAELGVKTIIMTGAGGKSEPGLFKGLLPILERASSLGMSTAMFTNGSQFGDDKVARIHNLSAVELAHKIRELKVSLFIACETLEPDLYSNITKKPIAPFQTGLINLIAAGFIGTPGEPTSVTISSVIMRQNFEELPVLQKFAHNNGWQYICKFPTLVGSALDHPELFFSPEEAAERHSIVAELRDKPETLTVTHSGAEYCLVNQVGMSFDNLGTPLNCLSGCEITSRKDMNLKSMRLADIVLLKKHLAHQGIGNCPKKAVFYDFKQPKLEAAAFHGLS